MSPLFVFNNVEEKILNIAQSFLGSEEHFIVEIKISGSPQGKKVKILADGDNGFSIDDCVDLSRKVGEEIEAQNLFENKYILEVSTPGVGQPLKLQRQYIKNIGRPVRIIMESDSSEIKGTLLKVNEKNIEINQIKTIKEGKKKKTIEESALIELSEINKINVLISL